MKFVPLSTVAALCVMLLVSCSRQPQMNSASASQLSTVAVAKTAIRSLSHDVVLTAEFKPFQEIDVMAKVAGYVKNIDVDAGDRVKTGQLIAVLEIPEMASDIARAEASLQHSKAEVAHARDELQRAQAAHEMNHLAYQRLDNVSKSRPGLVAQQEIDDAHSRDLQGEAQVAAARSSLSAADEQVRVTEAEQTKIKTMFQYTRVTAPFTGVITKRFANTGSMIQAGISSTTQTMPLVRLSEIGVLRLILPVPESQVPLMKIGKSVSVNVPTLHRTFPGRIARFSNELQTSTRTMETEVDVQNPQLVIMPGMYAEVTLSTGESLNVLTVPLQALGGSETKRTVLVVNSGGTVEEKTVEVGIESSDYAEVKSGLVQGELVVVGSRSQLKPGQQVTPRIIDAPASQGGA